MKVLPLENVRRRGVALVVVLSLLVLVTIIGIAFFTSVTSEVAASRVEADMASVRQLADSTTHYVIGQLRLATSKGSTHLWTSQPGLIRSYDNTGSLDSVYKLYSSSLMAEEIADGSYDAGRDAPPTNWMSNPAEWTDLNAPVTVRGANGIATPVFPILDPRASAPPTGKTAPLVEGFSYDINQIGGGVVATSTADNAARVPMPVRWLYQLRDGSFVAPASVTSGTATFSASNGPVPSQANPIVARVAFWTDDETCKLNLNTAAGGTPWDDPRYTNGIEQGFSRYKPSKNEFTRYPGHPASTSLVPVFWSYGGLDSPDESLFPFHTPSSAFNFQYNDASASDKADIRPQLSAKAESYYRSLLAFNPRNAWGGSEMGTKPTVIFNGPIVPPLDSDRLFASVDEMLIGAPDATSGPRPDNPLNLTTSDVNMLRFFVTSHNRAPDLSPLGQPKVGMWPIAEKPQKRTPVDHLLAFCSTLAGKPFYFTRDNAESSTADMTQRNEELLDYLARSMAVDIPGFGGNLQTRYGSEGIVRLLTLTYDYTRSAINLIDTYQADTSNNNNIVAPFAFAVPPPKMGDRGSGQVTPIVRSVGGKSYKGLGRFPVIKQVGIQFVARAANQPPSIIASNGVPTGAPNPMHPWVGPMPASVAVTNKQNGTYELSAVNAYPVVTGQTHAGLPFLPTRWIADQTILEADPDDQAKITLRQEAINPRYQGPGDIYGTSGNSQLLPRPVINTSAGSLAPHQTEMEAVILIDPVINSPSNPPYSGKYQVRVLHLDTLSVDGQSLGFGADVSQVPTRHNKWNNGYSQGYYGVSTFGRSTVASGGNVSSKLNFLSGRVIVGNLADQGQTFSFSGGRIVIEVRTEPTSGIGELIQTMTVDLPAATFPTPLLPPQPIQGIRTWLVSTNINDPMGDASAAYKNSGVPTTLVDIASANVLSLDLASPLIANSNFGVGANVFKTGGGTSAGRAWFDGATSNDFFPLNFIAPERMTNPASDERAKLSADTVRTVEVIYGDTRVVGSLPDVGPEWFTPHRHYHNTAIRSAHSMRQPDASSIRGTTDQSLTAGVKYHPDGGATDLDNFRGLPAGAPAEIKELSSNYPASVGSSARYIRNGYPDVTSSAELDDAKFSAAWGSRTPFSTVWASGGDYDTGIGLTVDGPYINKPNEGGQMMMNNDPRNTNPEFNNDTWSFSTHGLNSAPNRQVPSSVILGSLPVGVTPETSWRTLLFSANPNSTSHAALGEMTLGGGSPQAGRAPDFLYLDFFSMPVVEPYAISEPFSTAGRVNMNYEIAPFTYIRRDTALRGVLRSSLLTAVEDRWAYTRKMQTSSFRYDVNNLAYKNYLQANEHWGFRYPIHPGETLKQFDHRFAAGDAFRSPSEICSLFLYPAAQPNSSNPEAPESPLVTWDQSNTNISTWWYNDPGGSRKAVTADNMRERPYASLYPQLTTRSNTYTVHFRVQTVQKVPSTQHNVWVEERDRVVSEFRGASTVERYIDPAEPGLPDAALGDVSLDDYYRYRILDLKRFAP